MKIRNWAKFQHFKDRSPPWVKLYRDLLDDPDWHDLDGDTAKVLIHLWLIASEDKDQNGSLPDIRRLSFRLRLTESKTKQALTKLSHWLIQDDINPISTRYQDDAPETETETKTETETETKTETEAKTQRGTRLPADCILPVDWANFCKQERPDLVAGKVFDEFRDYWIAQPGQKGVKTNWGATWRNWVRNQRSTTSYKTATERRQENNDRAWAEFLGEPSSHVIEGVCSHD